MRKNPFPELSHVEQKALHPDMLRHWARFTYQPLTPIDPAWHPVVVAECQAINEEIRGCQAIPLVNKKSPIILQSVRGWECGSLDKIVKDNLTQLAELLPEPAVPSYPINMEEWDDGSDTPTLDLTPALTACACSGAAPIMGKIADEALQTYLSHFQRKVV